MAIRRLGRSNVAFGRMAIGQDKLWKTTVYCCGENSRLQTFTLAGLAHGPLLSWRFQTWPETFYWAMCDFPQDGVIGV